MKKIEIFKTGKHTDSQGRVKEWTEADLDRIVQKYNPKEHEAPVVVGHPKDNAPAFGWVEGLERKGSVLYAKLKDLVPEFVGAVKQGLYKKRSMSLYPDMTLKHVGFLGAMPPAVKGLADVAFSAEEEETCMTIEFAEDCRMSTVGGIFRKLREYFIEKFGQAEADKIVSNWEIDELERQAMGPEETVPAFTEKQIPHEEENMGEIEELKKQLKDKDEQLAEFAEGKKKTDEQLAELQRERDAEKKKVVRTGFQQFCEGLSKEGKLPPAVVPAALDFMEILSGVETFEFAEGDGKKAAAPVEQFQSFLSGLGKVIEFKEVATKDKGAEAGDAEQKRKQLVTEFMEKNEGTDIKTATLAVSKEHPELFSDR